MKVDQATLKKLRTDKGWTQQQLADIAGLSLRTVSRTENQGLASNETVNALCAIYTIERDQILTPEASESVEAVSKTTVINTRFGLLLAYLAGLSSGLLLLSFFS